MEQPQMSDWDLMMPGMGLTAIGLAGVILSYLGIANTFLTGMQALSGLTMFIGMVFLSAGILSGGVSTSGRAKATTLVIFGISGSVGAYAISLNKVVTSLPSFVGVLIMILIPTIVIAFTAMKMQKYFKPIAIIFILASVVAIGSYTAFGFIGPGAQFHLTSVQNTTNATNATSTPAVPSGPVANVVMSVGASKQAPGQKYFDPQDSTIKIGTTVIWKNVDSMVHTVTSGDPNAGPSGGFDSDLVKPGKTFQHKFDSAGTTSYYCTVHPWMTGKVIVG